MSYDHHWITRLSSAIHRMTEIQGGSNLPAIAQRGQGRPLHVPTMPLPGGRPGLSSCLTTGLPHSLLPQNLKAIEKPCLLLPERHQTLPQFRKTCSHAREHSNLRLLSFLLLVRMEKNNPSSFEQRVQELPGVGLTVLVLFLGWRTGCLNWETQVIFTSIRGSEDRRKYAVLNPKSTSGH